MGTKLYVANLPDGPDPAALRAHFSACGIVSDVRIVSDRNTGRQETAYVSMGSEAAATRALAELNRRPFGGKLLLLEAAPEQFETDRRFSTRQKDKREEDTGVRITTQFRESENMTYELDCAGVVLVLRVFFPTATGEQRILAQAGSARDAPSTAGTASSRLEALRNIARDSREGGAAAPLGRIDWAAVEQAMTTVRAV
jgi:RNA recognition motif-containing protein